MKDSIKMIAAIVIFATVACVGLAFVYDGTKAVIAEHDKETLEAAQKTLFPDADSFETLWDGSGDNPVVSGSDKVTFNAEYKAMKDGKVEGLIVNSQSYGFSDNVAALVGIDAAGKITGVNILSDNDTPGLGANAANDKYFVDKTKGITFYGQFTGMTIDNNIKVKKDGGDVTAITASTISSRAVSLLVSEALKAGYKWLSENGGAGAPEAAEGETPTPEAAVPNNNGGS